MVNIIKHRKIEINDLIMLTTQVVRFTVGCLDLFIFLEIVDKSTNCGTCSPGLFVDIFEPQ
jgi:hypothetical protein